MSLELRRTRGAETLEPSAGAGEPARGRAVRELLMLADGIGQKLRQRRKVRKLSLSEVATRAGLSIGLLSQIERGVSTPSLRALNQICEALEMPLRWLFDAEEEDGNPGAEAAVVRLSNRRRMDLGYAGMTKEILSPDSVPQLQLMRFVIRPGGKSGDSPNRREGGAKAGTVVSGCLGLQIDGREYLLKPGDSFSFVATAQYRFWCVGDQDCELFWVVTPALY